MRISTSLPYTKSFPAAVTEVQELERAGLDTVWVPELYTFDAISQMGYLAALTERVRIGTGIIPIYSRTPALIAMTAAGIDMVSNGRALLGIGASGPQVVEGWHAVPYDAPLARTREIIEICRKVWRRERLEHQGKKYQIPLGADQGTGLGKPLKLISHPVRDDIPIAVASLTPKSVEMTAEIADGWKPVLYHPTKSDARWGDALRAGKAKRDPLRAPLEVFVGGAVGIGEGLEPMRDLSRPGLALYIGGMGARQKNFYNDVFKSYGYEAEAANIQDLYLAGQKKEAAAAIPKEFLDEISLVGSPSFVKEQLGLLRDSGVTSLNIALMGRTAAERVKTLDALQELIAQL